MGVKSSGANGIRPVAMFTVPLAVNTPSTWGVPRTALHVLHAGGPRPALPGHHGHALPAEVRRRGIGQRPREEVRGPAWGGPGDDLDGAAGECGVLPA